MCLTGPQKQFKAEVHGQRALSEEYFRLTLFVPEGVEASPGQFFNLKTGGTPEPLWRRPFSVFDQNERLVDFYIRIVGRGTQWLSEVKQGQSLDVLGPLGKGFEMPKAGQKSILVAGGVGVAPLHFLAKRLIDRGGEVSFLWGGADRFAVDLAESMDVDQDLWRFATMDGSVGFKGFVTELLARSLDEASDSPIVFSCGPEQMLKRVVAICRERDIPVQVSFESKMACGWGVCLGCPVLVKSGDSGAVYKRVCTDGPILWGSDLVFE